MNYPIGFIYNEENSEYTVIVPDIAGCQTTCLSIDNGLYDIRIAIEDHLKILAEYGETIPKSKKIETHQQNVNNVIWAIIDIDITPYLGKSHKINVTLPELLIKQIDDRVSKSEEHKTRSGFIAAACLNLLHQG